jgi:hypothetical protein
MNRALKSSIAAAAIFALASIAHAGECMRNVTEARARELEGLGHQ